MKTCNQQTYIVIKLDNSIDNDNHVDESLFCSYLIFSLSTTCPIMADACFTARATTREHVRSSIAKLTLLTNASGQYNHNHATTFIAGIRRILRETYNPGDPGNGMDKLCMASNASPASNPPRSPPPRPYSTKPNNWPKLTSNWPL